MLLLWSSNSCGMMLTLDTQESPSAGPETVVIAVKLPSGCAPRRRFARSAPLRQLYDWAQCGVYEELFAGDAGVCAASEKVAQLSAGGHSFDEIRGQLPDSLLLLTGAGLHGTTRGAGDEPYTCVTTATAEAVYALSQDSHRSWLLHFGQWILVEPYPRKEVTFCDNTLAQAGLHGQVLLAMERCT